MCCPHTLTHSSVYCPVQADDAAAGSYGAAGVADGFDAEPLEALDPQDRPEGDALADEEEEEELQDGAVHGMSMSALRRSYAGHHATF